MRLGQIGRTPSRGICVLRQRRDTRRVELANEPLVQVAALGVRVSAVFGHDVGQGPFLGFAEARHCAAGSVLWGLVI